MNTNLDTLSVFSALGTVNMVYVQEDEGRVVLERITEKVKNLDDTLSLFKSGSEVSRINRYAGVRAIGVSEDTYELIKKAVYISNITKGAFDITINPVMDVWRKAKDKKTLPDHMEILKALELVNYRDIDFDDKNKMIYLKRKGQSIDLGGIAKGYAVDASINILQENNIKNAVINFGGTVAVIGHISSVGIQHPLLPVNRYMGSILLENRCISTSGKYQNNYTVNNVKYHHIIDKRTGYPVENDIQSISVIGNDATLLDALSTASICLWPDLNNKLNRKFNLDYVCINNDMDVYSTLEVKLNYGN